MPKQVHIKNLKTAWKRSESPLTLRQWARSQAGIEWLSNFVDMLNKKYAKEWAKVLKHNNNSGEVTPKVALVTGNK
jgi:hypothetical protein